MTCDLSPYSLPYIGIETYSTPLVMSGHTDKAKEVRRYTYLRECKQNQKALLILGRKR
jgi:hypothetical protein